MTDDSVSATARALARLTAAESELRDELVSNVLEHALSRPLRELVDLEQVRGVMTSALSEANLERIVARHVRPGWRRYAQAIIGSETTVGALVPDAARPRIRAIARELRLPRARWAKGAVDPALVRRFLAPVWTQVLLSFATRLPIPGIGGSVGGKREGSSVAGFLARSVQGGAEKLIDRGRSMMGGLGAEVERRLLEAARGFSDNAAEIFRDALRERVASEEGRELLERITTGIVDRVFEAKFSDLQLDADALPLDAVFDVAPQVVAHAAPGRYVQEILQREIAAYIAVEGERPLRELLDELGIAAQARALVLARGQALAAGFFASPAFSDWLSRVLAE
jgi:hypothetical protein